MKQENATSTIASFAVLKALNDAKTYKSPYQLLGNFIGYVIASDTLRVGNIFRVLSIKSSIRS